MQKLSNTKLIAVISKLLVLLLIAKIIALVVWWYLPSEGVALHAKKSYQAKYQRVQFSNMLLHSKAADVAGLEKTKTKAYSINNLLLKGLYGSKFNGFVIVAKKSSPKKTEITAVGESYEGYKLKQIDLNNVTFTKASKEYILSLKESKNKMSDVFTKVKRTTSASEDEKQVTREDIKRYSNNPSQIWKDIAIAPLKKAGKIVGFKVNRIKKNSKMATLGLKKGDVITKANNVKLSSFNDALKLYKNIDKIDTIALTIQRDNQEKEIIYEIR
ncbi:PDZ domain-containing protein [Sulfurimonas sp.]|uniref:PDZ domain-containing protein n=1 Tax=Sulfurimonas sp. TaxID=2022749 RepID=UPI0025F05612|nr:PDZ domain-containing protein [Sulfurimonas sp.]MBT5935858.1 PDZ domain-containing protein [Sulfurimonas sp.]